MSRQVLYIIHIWQTGEMCPSLETQNMSTSCQESYKMFIRSNYNAIRL